MNPNTKLIIFDMDGVILDSEPLHESSRQMMFHKYKIVPDGTLPNPVGKSTSGFWKLLMEKYHLEGDPDKFEEEQYSLVAQQIKEKHIPPSKGLLKILDWAKSQDVEIALASSSSRMLVEKVLRLLQINHYFDYSVAGDEVPVKKPAPDVYQSVLRMSDIPASQAIALEDSSTGIQAAQAAGIFCYGYVNPTSGNQDLSRADQIITRLTQILEN